MKCLEKIFINLLSATRDVVSVNHSVNQWLKTLCSFYDLNKIKWLTIFYEICENDWPKKPLTTSLIHRQNVKQTLHLCLSFSVYIQMVMMITRSIERIQTRPRLWPLIFDLWPWPYVKVKNERSFHQSGYSCLRKSSSSFQLANQYKANIFKASADWSVID